jgi:hypothetical protein
MNELVSTKITLKNSAYDQGNSHSQHYTRICQ